MSIKHQVKVTYFKLIRLGKCSQNQWRHCKIISFCIKALDLQHLWTMQWYKSTDKIFGGELKYEVLLFLQRNNNSTHTSYRQPFYWKSAFASLLTKAWATLFTVELFCDSCLHAPLKQDRPHFTTLCFNLYAHQSTVTDLATGIYNTFICWMLSSLYGFNVINTFYY